MTNIDGLVAHATDELANACDVLGADVPSARDGAGPRGALAASLARLDEAIGAAIAQFDRSLESDAASAPSRTEYITRDDTARMLSRASCEGNSSIPATVAGEPKFAVPIKGPHLTELRPLFGLTAPELDALRKASSRAGCRRAATRTRVWCIGAVLDAMVASGEPAPRPLPDGGRCTSTVSHNRTFPPSRRVK